MAMMVIGNVFYSHLAQGSSIGSNTAKGYMIVGRFKIKRQSLKYVQEVYKERKENAKDEEMEEVKHV